MAKKSLLLRLNTPVESRCPSPKVLNFTHPESFNYQSAFFVPANQEHCSIRHICEIYPDAVAAPFILVGTTDTVHYTDLCDNIYRFIPVHLFERDTQRFHGIDKRTSRDNYLNIIRFYHQFIKYSSVN